jgi:E3 ubiquitin-protein transferase RMND5
MHLMREGQFGVASTFIKESEDDRADPMEQGLSDLKSETLRSQFKDMYDILEEMRVRRNLGPAAAWAREHRQQLEERGSNLEFELARLRFLWLFTNHPAGQSFDDPWESQRIAIKYAREALSAFQELYPKEVQKLVGATAFASNLQDSPYRQFIINDGAWEQLAISFTREFCSLLGLSADSPVYIASIAGAIALPRLQKMEKIMESHDHANWTTQSELPVSRAINVVYQKLTIKGRDPFTARLPIPLYLRMPRLQRADDR